MVTIENRIEVDPKRSLVPIQMVGDRVLISPIEPEKELSPGLVKPADYKEPYMKGKVMSFGAGEYGVKTPDSLVVGTTVAYWHQSKVPFKVEDKEYDMVRTSEIFAYL